jgi:hypothetical protein
MEKSIFNYFPRIVYTYRNYICRWCALTQYFKPVCANAFGFPVLLLVPSGKKLQNGDAFLCTPNPLIAGIACFGLAIN